jgi:hypothetical protein
MAITPGYTSLKKKKDHQKEGGSGSFRKFRMVFGKVTDQAYSDSICARAMWAIRRDFQALDLKIFNTFRCFVLPYSWLRLVKSNQVTNLRMPSKWHICKEGQAGNKKRQRRGRVAYTGLSGLVSLFKRT